MKGEAEASAARAGTAKKIADALQRALDSMHAWMREGAKVSDDNLTVEGSYRSNLPKEGAYEVGEYEYERMVSEEISGYRRTLAPLLAPFKDQIAKVEVYDGEKSWIYTNILLK